MEFLKKCATNVLTTDDFSTVGYWISSVNGNSDLPEAVVNDSSSNHYANVILSTLLDNKVLASLDRDQDKIWIFAGGGKTEFHQIEVQNLAQMNGLSLKTIHIGEMQASELCEPSGSGICTSASSTPLSASTPSSAGRHTQPLSARTPKSAVSANSYDRFTKLVDIFEPSRIYRMFITAVLSLIAYTLASSQTAIPLGFREFLTLPYDTTSSQGYRDQSHEFFLSTLYVQLTLRGHLILSVSSRANSKWKCMSSAHEKAQFSGGVVRLAPSGIEVSLLRSEAHRENANFTQDDSSTECSLKRYSGMIKWKRRVSSWLHEHGLRIEKPDSKCHWLWVESPPFADNLDSNCCSARSHSFLWPAQLCFYLAESRSKGAKNMFAAQIQDYLAMFNVDAKDRLGLLQGKQIEKRSDSFRSSLRLAEEFLLETISAEPQRFDDDYASRPAESSSSIQTRSAQNIDLNLPNGVYPTPPDCVTGPSTSLTEVSNTTAAVGDISTRSEVESPGSEIQSYKKADNPSNLPINEDDEPNAFVTMETSENQLFSETDRNELEANGITDADFNFFDEPDADMMSYTNRVSLVEHGLGPQIEPNLDFAAHFLSEEGSQNINQIVTPDNENPENVVDEAGLPKNFMTTLSSRGENTKSPSRAKIEENVSHIVAHSPQKYSETMSSPSSFDIQQQNRIPSSKRGSLFHPMGFDWEMTISDAKYSAKGRYSFNRKDSIQKDDESNMYAVLAARTNNIAQTKSCPLNNSCILQLKERACDARLPAAKFSQSSDSESFQSDVSSHLDSEPSDIEDVEKEKSLNLDKRSPLSPELRGFDQPNLKNQSYVWHLHADTENVGRENVDFLDKTEGILNFLQPNFDDKFNTTVPNTSASSFKDLIQQSLRQNHEGENNISSNIGNIGQGSFSLNALAQNVVRTVQILVDQIARGSWILPQEDGHPSLHPCTSDITTTDIIEDRLLLAVKQYALPMFNACDVVQFASLDYYPPEATKFQKFQARSSFRRSSAEGQTSNTAGTQIHQMPATLFRIQRHDSLLELSPSSLAFWEALGLAPSSGPKNVHAHCVFVDNEGNRNLIDNLLTTITIVYESCKFGVHARGSDFKQYKGGMIPLKMVGEDGDSYKINDLQQAFGSLGEELADLYSTHEKSFFDHTINVVLYVIYPLDEKTSLWQVCSSFLRLQQEFQRSQSLSAYAPRAMNITLQLIPIDLITSHLALQPHHFMQLANEIYDRCQPADSTKDKIGSDIFCAPSLQLAESLPKSIPFRLSPDPPSDLLNETACMHVAYAKSGDGRWITAAWTDSLGKRQAHITYNVEGKQSFNDIAKEIWQTTSEIIQRRRVAWKVIIVAVMEMVRDDIDVWTALVTIPTHPVVFTLLLSIGLDVPLRLSAKEFAGEGYHSKLQEQTMYSPDSNLKHAEAEILAPTSIPNAESFVTSPVDFGGNLVDINDETWAVILAHRSNVSKNMSEYRPSLASGLLVKRVEDSLCHPSPLPMREEVRGPVCVALDLLRVCNSSGNGSTNGANSAGALSALQILGPRGCDHMLREILFMYGSLGLLAKYRGMRDTRGGLIPWHVVMVTRGIKVLESCLS